jgi:hypothetical protein
MGLVTTVFANFGIRPLIVRMISREKSDRGAAQQRPGRDRITLCAHGS